MAKVTNSFTSYDATSNREDLSNVIYNIDPTATPFMSAIGSKNITNVVFDWQTENLPTPSGTGQLEGFELSRATSTATTRESNVAQISSRDATVSGSQDASDPAGKKQELAHQMALMSKALKRDMEVALCQNTAKNAGNATLLDRLVLSKRGSLLTKVEVQAELTDLLLRRLLMQPQETEGH